MIEILLINVGNIRILIYGILLYISYKCSSYISIKYAWNKNIASPGTQRMNLLIVSMQYNFF